MRKILKKYRSYFSNQAYLVSIFIALILLFTSIVVNFYASTYATNRASNFVNDIILNNIPTFDVDTLFVFGPIVLFAFALAVALHDPKRLPFGFKSVSLFVLIRSLFITLTHIGPFPDRVSIVTSSDVLSKFIFGGDLFFSAHTGLPFLLALMFWKNKPLRLLFTCAAVGFGVVVLMGHLHYSIDVLAAFFITYTIHHIAEVIFKKDWVVFNEGLNVREF